MKRENLEILPELFKRSKCWKIDELSRYLNYSVISVRLILKKLGYYRSITCNGKWYTLQYIPDFDMKGLWIHNEIVFSQHGNLNETISHFINKSNHGLTAGEIAATMSFPCNVTLNKMIKSNQIYRIPARGHYIYLSKGEDIRQNQIDMIYKSGHSPLPSANDAISILVAIIKNPKDKIDELVKKLITAGLNCNLESVTLFLRYHDIEKKNNTQINNVLLFYIEKLTDGVPVARILGLPNDIQNSFRLNVGIKCALNYAGKQLKGVERRRLMAKTVLSLGEGGQRLAEKEFNWNRGTIRKGIHEFESGISCIDYYSGRGRKMTVKKLPALSDDITDIVKPGTQADPTFKTTRIYTPLTTCEVYKRLIEEKGYSEKQLPCVRTLSSILNNLNFHPQTVAKTKPLKKIKETDNIFQVVHHINRITDKIDGVLRLSADAKAKIDIGPFSRKGKSRQGEKGVDHDFAPEHILKLFGFFLPQSNQSYFYFHEGNITADFMVDCLADLWPTLKLIYNPHTLVLNLDNGPENSSKRTQFIKRIVDFAYKNHVNIKLAYYPPYHSKYNPIERVWGVLEQHWNGEILYSIKKTLGLARTMTYNSVNPEVKLIEDEYLKGITLTKKEMAFYEEKICRREGLEKWFVDVVVRYDYAYIPWALAG